MSTPNLARTMTYVLEHAWAVTPDVLHQMAVILARRLSGQRDEEAIVAALEVRDSRRTSATPAGAGVAVLPLHGMIASRMNLMTEISGGTSYDEARAELGAALADPAIGTIVLDIDSPGGCVAGATELARAILAGRAQKPIIAHVHYTCGSAAYWCASCATEIVAAPASLIGSLGVYTVHENLAKALEQQGIDITFIYAGKYKVEGNPTGPLSDEARAHRQTLIDDGYAAFTTDVARGRGVSVEAVRAGYGEGRMLSTGPALAAGLIDRVATFDDTLTRLTGAAPVPRTLAAAAVDTTQEPLAATVQDRQKTDTAFLRDLELALLTMAP